MLICGMCYRPTACHIAIEFHFGDWLHALSIANCGLFLDNEVVQNNIQVMRADAWRPLRYRAEIYEGVGHASSLPSRERLHSAVTMNYDIERTKLTFGERSFAVSGPTAWNTLPANLKCIGNILSFKRNLKTHLFSIA